MLTTTRVSKLVAALKQCSGGGDLDEGRRVHGEAVESGLASNRYVVTSLINMYAKCGCMVDARNVFESLDHATKDVTSWTALILGYSNNGQSLVALDMFQAMHALPKCIPDARTYVAAVTACTNLTRMREGKEVVDMGKDIHDRAVKHGCCDVFVENALITMYARCTDMVAARCVFDKMVYRDVISWTCLLQGYVDNGESELGVLVFHGMLNHGCVPNARTFVAALSACAALGWSAKGKAVYSQAVCTNCSNLFVHNAAIDMFAQCNQMAEAQSVFDSMDPECRNVVSWTALLQGYVGNGECEVALDMFHTMQTSCGIAPDPKAFVAALTACTRAICLAKGKAIHAHSLSTGCCDFLVLNALLDMYGKSGSMVHAQHIFDTLSAPSLVSWTLLLQGYVDNGQSQVALVLFDNMDRSPDCRAFVVALSACAALASDDGKWISKGMSIHLGAITDGCYNPYVQTTLVDMYAKCGCMAQAHCVFDDIARPHTVEWTSLIMGYANSGDSVLALKLAATMDLNGVAFSCLTFVAALTACGNIMALQLGNQLYEEINQNFHLLHDTMLANCLVDFYGKCGDMAAAKQVFDSIPHKTTVSWTALMYGYSLQGQTCTVIQLFDEMRKHGVSPDGVTFICLLTGCSHAGLTDQGKMYFKSMHEEFGINPTVKHYTCLIDLLCRAKHVDEALQLVHEMPSSTIAWITILDTCQNFALAKQVYDTLLETDVMNPSAYVLMSRNCNFS